MKKSKKYIDTYFKPEVISEAKHKLAEITEKKINSEIKIHKTLSVKKGDVTWDHDNEEEFFSDYQDKSIESATYRQSINYGNVYLEVWFYYRDTYIYVQSDKRENIESIFNIFEKNLNNSKLPKIDSPIKEKQLPKIFIGHGKNPQWRDLKDHLQDKQKYKIEAYEVGARAGHEIRDVLQSMLKQSSFAILVMTGEDEGLDGKLYPRGNVVHELGLFQGGLGFDRAIVLLEEGTEQFSNISGVTQIRFPKGKIKETFGDVVATLRREFE